MSFNVIFNELYEFIKSRDRWRCFIIRQDKVYLQIKYSYKMRELQYKL